AVDPFGPDPFAPVPADPPVPSAPGPATPVETSVFAEPTSAASVGDEPPEVATMTATVTATAAAATVPTAAQGRLNQLATPPGRPPPAAPAAAIVGPAEAAPMAEPGPSSIPAWASAPTGPSAAR